MSTSTLRERLDTLRGAAPPRPMDARTLAALAANPGCRRRALLDAAGADKGALARHLGSPAPFGQSQFAIVRGNVFEARVKADGCAALLKLLTEQFQLAVPDRLTPPDLSAPGLAGRAERTRRALAEATRRGAWALLDHPLLGFEVAGCTTYVEPDAVLVHPDGRWTVLEIKSFPILDGSADPAKVGAAARQAAVYVMALRSVARALGAGRPDHTVLLVCPRDFSNLPTGAMVDVRRQLGVTERQLARLARLEEIAAELPEGTTFDLCPGPDGAPTRPVAELAAAVDAVPARYAPDCLAACELAFHCRRRARDEGALEALGRSVRAEFGSLDTVRAVLDALPPSEIGAEAALEGEDTVVHQVRRAARLRAAALACGRDDRPLPGGAGGDGPE
ncbi:hypothetical protein AQ490_05335 [Wenjunlia vitaminophila]|uniref:Secreted protein n=1 Tax=Wenjunlia vitaminophila TaxID=76728 RepID=A0A0T6LNW5_WENVI|nr:hypothetical protein AQ490_05335 [Wenjunlia vitaminophila]